MKHETLRARISEKGLSVRKLAEVCGMDHSVLSRKLIGRRRFYWFEVVAICKALEIDNPFGWFES